MTPNVFIAYLSEQLNSGEVVTSIGIDRLTTLTGETLLAADISVFGHAVLTINPDADGNTSFVEYGEFTGVTANTDGSGVLTGITRGLSAKDYTSSAGRMNFYPPGTRVVISFGAHNILDLLAYVDNSVAGLLIGTATVEAGLCGENVIAGNLVYLKNDGKWWKSDADLPATVEGVRLGIAQGAGTANGAITSGVLTRGLDSNQTGLVAGTTYYVSNTAGAISASAGTTPRVIGIGKDSTHLYFDSSFFYTLTANQQAAVGGSSGVPSGTNKLLTQDTAYSSQTDQSQTTQDSSTAVGEANSTTKRNKVAQSFTAGRTKIAGARLYKSADTGTFTGTVKVALQADTAGSPSGTDLASATMTNAAWLALATGTFDVVFGTQYAALVAGTLYWVVVTPSTSDNLNHPNLGVNSAGGYASGSLKYNNSTDSWVATTTDLYFQTLAGTASVVAQTDATEGRVPVSVLPYGLIELNNSNTDVSATSGTSAETVVYSKNLPAGTFALNSGIRVSANTSFVGFNTNDAYTVKVKLNGTTVVTFTSTVGASVRTQFSDFVATIINNNSMTAQKYQLRGLDISRITGGAVFTSLYTDGTTAVDTTGSVELSVTIQTTASGTTSTASYTGTQLEKIGS